MLELSKIDLSDDNAVHDANRYLLNLRDLVDSHQADFEKEVKEHYAEIFGKEFELESGKDYEGVMGCVEWATTFAMLDSYESMESLYEGVQAYHLRLCGRIDEALENMENARNKPRLLNWHDVSATTIGHRWQDLKIALKRFFE